MLLLDVDGVLAIPPKPFSLGLTDLNSAAAPSALVSRRRAATTFFTGIFQSAIIGQADLKELLVPLMTELDLPGTPDTLMDEWFAAENVLNLPLLEAVKELRGAGWPVYLATNQERHRLHYLLHDMGLGQFVDGEFASCTVGVRKPDAAYFERVQERLNLSPARIVFWDDAPANVQAARAAGWTAHLYENLAGFTREMARLTLA